MSSEYCPRCGLTNEELPDYMVEAPEDVHSCPDSRAEHVCMFFCRASGTEGDDFPRDVRAIRLEHLPRSKERALGALVLEVPNDDDEPVRFRRWEPPENSPVMVELRFPVAPAAMGTFGAAAIGSAPLLRRLVRLGEHERRVVEHIIARLELGREQYGPLNLHDDGRDFMAETVAEMLDAQIYLTIAALQAEEDPGYLVESAGTAGTPPIGSSSVDLPADDPARNDWRELPACPICGWKPHDQPKVGACPLYHKCPPPFEPRLIYNDAVFRWPSAVAEVAEKLKTCPFNPTRPCTAERLLRCTYLRPENRRGLPDGHQCIKPEGDPA
jgi:hypothetical protein